MSYFGGGVPDAPWIGHCKEEWDDMCSSYDEEEENYFSEQDDIRWKMMQEEGGRDD